MTVTINLTGARGGQGTTTTAAALALLAARRGLVVELVARDVPTMRALLGMTTDEKLDRRKAIVYVHPTGPACCSRLIPGVVDTLIEYGTDTTRAIASSTTPPRGPCTTTPTEAARVRRCWWQPFRGRRPCRRRTSP